MDIKNVLDERIICNSLEAKDKEDALRQMSKMLEKTGYIDNKDAFLKDIFYRESLGCTGIGNGVAIPHGKSPSVTKVGIAIAKLTNEIKWETLDGKGVKVILLFAVGDKTEDALTEEEIAQADVVILAIDVAISGKERFKGKKTVEVPTEMVVHSPNALIAKVEEIVKG